MAEPLINVEIAQRLKETARLLEEQGANPFRVQAYRRAAETVLRLDRPVTELLEAEGMEGLRKLRGIGESLARSIRDLGRTGWLPMLERLRGEADPVALLASVPGIGPALAGRLHHDLGIDTLEELEAAAHDGRLVELAGIGEKKLAGIVDSLASRLERVRQRTGRPAAPRFHEPSISELLDVDREYREKAAAGTLHRIAPRRFNPSHEAWLPVLHTQRGERHYTALLPPRTGPVTKRLEIGKPAELIVTIAQEQRVSLIVLGARGLGPVKERLLGSVSHRVLAHAACATLMVNHRMRALRQVLMPLQGPDDVEAAAAFLATRPFREAVDVTILAVPPFPKAVWPAGASVSEAVKKDILEGARLFVEDVASRLRALDYRAKGAAVLGEPVKVILQEATKRKVDLILMGARGRRGVTRFVLGSVSHAVLHHAPCPVLVFR